MIDVQKADKDRCCCVCHGRKDVYYIILRSEDNNSRTEIPICENCFWMMEITWDLVRLEEIEL